MSKGFQLYFLEPLAEPPQNLQRAVRTLHQSRQQLCSLLLFSSSCCRWVGLDFRARARAAQLISDKPQAKNKGLIIICVLHASCRTSDSSSLVHVSTVQCSPTSEPPACSVDSAGNHRAASLLDPAAGSQSAPAPSGGSVWTSGLRPEQHS